MWQLFRMWKRRAVEERDLDQELRAHLEIEARLRAGSGQDPTDSDIAARRAFGNLAKIREGRALPRGTTVIDYFWRWSL